MTETWVLGQHELIDARIHDAVEGRDLQKRPGFIAKQHNFPELGFYGVEGALCMDLKTKQQAKKKEESYLAQNQIFSANLGISYDMDLTPTMSSKKKTGSFGAITCPYPLEPYACSGANTK